MITYIPLLVFGGKDDDITDVACRDAFTEGFSIDAKLNLWKNVGAVPLTRSCLLSDMVCHEVVVEPDGNVDVYTDPEGNMLADLKFQNKVCCNMLTLKGFDGK